MKLTNQDIEFLRKYYQQKIERHEKILKGYKIALKELNNGTGS